MALRVFYSWQSDVALNRNFIRSALDDAVAELNRELTVDEAERELVVDQDTQGVPGSPSIAEAIQAKIRAADVFLADLTFIDEGLAEKRRTPNPNVMLEYGYALHALGDARIVGVFNEAAGSPEQLPFDLGHRRWPIRFHAVTGDSEGRQNQKRSLTRTLRDALASIVAQFGEPSGSVAPFVPHTPGDGIGRLRTADDLLCIHNETPISLGAGPYLFLRLIPTRVASELLEVEALRITQQHLAYVRHERRQLVQR